MTSFLVGPRLKISMKTRKKRLIGKEKTCITKTIPVWRMTVSLWKTMCRRSGIQRNSWRDSRARDRRTRKCFATLINKKRSRGTTSWRGNGWRDIRSARKRLSRDLKIRNKLIRRNIRRKWVNVNHFLLGNRDMGGRYSVVG